LAFGMRSRKVLQDQGSIEWPAAGLAKTSCQPNELVPLQRTSLH
jgi:hypothetical protein